MDFDLGGLNARAFLSEGLAEQMASTLPLAYSARDEVPGTAADGLTQYACDGSWSLRAIFPAAQWYQAQPRHGLYYQAAALFTEVAMEQMGGFWGYRRSFYQPAEEGTTADAEARLQQLTGQSFAGLERELRRRALAQRTPYWPCGEGYGGCPEACRCERFSGVGRGKCVLR